MYSASLNCSENKISSQWSKRYKHGCINSHNHTICSMENITAIVKKPLILTNAICNIINDCHWTDATRI